MGIRLIVEVLDHWQDAGLTPGERWDLLVLAENANDGTRLTYGPVHAQHILERANKSPKGWKNAITALMRKKVITTHVPGRIKQVAVYHLEHLCPEPPHDGYKGHCTRPPKDQEEGHPSGDPLKEEGHPAGDPMGHPAGDPLGQEGHPADAERVIQQVTPTPPNPSSKETPLTTPSSSVAEDSATVTDTVTVAAEGGGGGREISSEDQDQTRSRAEAFVSQLDYRGKAPDKQQQQRLCALVAAALAAGWSEGGLSRYLDISDDPNVRNAASLYAYKLHGDRLPDAGPAEAVAAGLPPVGPDCFHDPAAAWDATKRVTPLGDPCPDCHPAAQQLPPACSQCLAANPGAATDVSLRVDGLSFGSGLCPRCHPAIVGQQATELPPACDACIAENPAAATNPRWRHRTGPDGSKVPCDDCNPGRVAFLAKQRQQKPVWGTVATVGKPRQLTGTDARVAGWMAIARQLGAEGQSRPQGHQPYRNPTDQSVYDEDFGPGPAVDPGGYDQDF